MNQWTNLHPALCLLLSFALRLQTAYSFTTHKSVSSWNTQPMNRKTRSGTVLFLSTKPLQQQMPQGLTKTISNVGSGRPIRLGDIVTVQYHAYLPISKIDSDMVIPITIAKSSPKQKVIVGDGMMIAGWDAALLSMVVGERAIVRVDDSTAFGYGAKGVPPIVPPNAPIEMDIQILDAEEAPRFVSASGGMGNVGLEETLGAGKAGSGEWSLLDPSKPV